MRILVSLQRKVLVQIQLTWYDPSTSPNKRSACIPILTLYWSKSGPKISSPEVTATGPTNDRYITVIAILYQYKMSGRFRE